MTTRRQWLLILLIAGLGAMAGYWLRLPPPDCGAITLESAITKRAAEICTTNLVGCSLSFEQVRRIVAEQHEAESCK